MESYDVFLINNFVALDAFKQKYGVFTHDTNPPSYVIVTKWQSALQVSGQLGALIGVFIAGPLTSRVGYCYATLIGLMLLNVFIFAFYFANSFQLSSSRSFSREFHGEFSLQTHRHTAVRLCRSSCEPLLLRCCKCSGPLAVLSLVPSPTVTTPCQVPPPTSMYKICLRTRSAADRKYTGSQSRCNGCSQPHLPFSSSAHQNRHGGLCARDVSKKQHTQSDVLDAGPD